MTSFVLPLLIVTVVSVFSTFSSNAGIFWLLPIKWYASVRMISGCGEEMYISRSGPPMARMSAWYGTV